MNENKLAPQLNLMEIRDLANKELGFLLKTSMPPPSPELEGPIKTAIDEIIVRAIGRAYLRGGFIQRKYGRRIGP